MSIIPKAKLHPKQSGTFRKTDVSNFSWASDHLQFESKC